jgi:prophage antirepressor-like protein
MEQKQATQNGPSATIVPFNFETAEVRSVLLDGQPWFVAKDVCEILDLSDPKSSVRLLDDDEKGVHTMHTLGGNQEMTVINESGLYSLVLRSRKPEAKAFKRWITHEVLPTLRKTGSYSIQVPQTLSEALQLAADIERERVALAAQALALESENAKKGEVIKGMMPKADFHDAVSSAINGQTIDQAAKVLGTGERRLFKQLKDHGYLRPNNEPYQEYIDRGYFRLREKKRNLPTGEVLVYTQTLVTGKGLAFLQRKLFGKQLEGMAPAELTAN